MYQDWSSYEGVQDQTVRIKAKLISLQLCC